MNRPSLSQWIKNFNDGAYDSSDVKTQIEAGWFDWFCKDQSLRNKTYALSPKVKRIAKSIKVNSDAACVLFKNNCPFYGSMYDDFRILDLTTGNLIFVVVPKCGSLINRGKTVIWGIENNFEEPLYIGNWEGALKWFNV